MKPTGALNRAVPVCVQQSMSQGMQVFDRKCWRDCGWCKLFSLFARNTILLETERKSFGRIFLHPDMMSDHIPDVYVSAIEALWKGMQPARE